MNLVLTFVRETDKARLYKFADGQERWVPRSVCAKTLKWPPNVKGEPWTHEVAVAGWWLHKEGIRA